MFSPSGSEDFSASIVQVTPCPSCTRSQPWFLCSAYWGPVRDTGELAGPAALLVSQALQQPLVLLQFALPREHLGLLENRRQVCNLQITCCSCPNWQSASISDLEIRQDLYSPWERKGKKQKRERKVCAVPDLTQQINIFLLNYLKGG